MRFGLWDGRLGNPIKRKVSVCLRITVAFLREITRLPPTEKFAIQSA